MDYGMAAQYFSQWEGLCKKDGGELWGVDLRTPFVLIDRTTRAAAANQPDNEGIFTLCEKNKIYTGTFPAHLTVAASTTEFGGLCWAMAPWDMLVQSDDTRRMETMVHEAFHCLQPTLFGKYKSGGDNGHMDETPTRILFLLEMSALLNALENDGEERKAAIYAALAARRERRKHHNHESDEIAFEIMEGTAVYTGIKLNHAGLKAQTAAIARYVTAARNCQSLAAFFGYVSGAMYGLVLDALHMPWRKSVTYETELAAVLANAMGVCISSLPPLEELNPEAYGYSEIAAAENEKAEKHAALVREMTEIFTQRPTLRMHEGGQTSINGMILPITELGTVLKGNVEYYGEFGRMHVRDGVFLSSSGFFLQEGEIANLVPAESVKIDGNLVTGGQWTLELTPGWEVKPCAQGYVLKKQEEKPC
jgi:hypothetical protein